jgi:PEP-CTERM motif
MRAAPFLQYVLVALVSAPTSWGALITSASQIGTPQTVIDFNQFAGANSITTMGPVSVGAGVTFQSTNPDGSILGSGPYSFNDNGTWNSSLTFAGLDVDAFGNDQYTMTFTFAHPVAAVGGLLNYAVFEFSGFSDATISALNSSGMVLESYDIDQLAPISTPGATNAEEFLGIARSQSDIAAFALSNSAIAITDLTFSGNVPEPNTTALCIAGLAVLLAAFCRRTN